MNNNKKYRKIVIIENGMEEHMNNNEKYKKIASVLSENEKEEFDELITMRSQLERELCCLMKRARTIEGKIATIDNIVDETLKAVEEAVQKEKEKEKEREAHEKAESIPVIITDGRKAFAAHALPTDDGIVVLTSAHRRYMREEEEFFICNEEQCNQEMADKFTEVAQASGYDARLLARAMLSVQLDSENEE